MTIYDLPSFLSEFFDFMNSPQWRAWPFNSGYGEHIIPAIARLAFVTIIMGAIILFLRALFGPNGCFRDEEMDREAEEQIQLEKDKLDELLAKGEIDKNQHAIRVKRL
jgi:uncharacterized membrane protein